MTCSPHSSARQRAAGSEALSWRRAATSLGRSSARFGRTETRTKGRSCGAMAKPESLGRLSSNKVPDLKMRWSGPVTSTRFPAGTISRGSAKQERGIASCSIVALLIPLVPIPSLSVHLTRWPPACTATEYPAQRVGSTLHRGRRNPARDGQDQRPLRRAAAPRRRVGRKARRLGPPAQLLFK